jgi:signal transduction histidine kinase
MVVPVGTTNPIPASKRRRRAFDRASAFRVGRRLSLRSRFLVALLAVLLVAETAIAVTYYNQRHQHSLNDQLGLLSQRMHEMADFQFGIAQVALQPAPIGAGQLSELASMVHSSEATWLRSASPANRPAVRNLEPRFEALARTRVRFDHLPAGSPQAQADKGRLIEEARSLMTTTNSLHHSVDAHILAARANAESGEDDAFQTFLAGSAISLVAAIALALLLARTISRPMERLAAGARQLGAGRLDYRLDARSHDEIGVVASEFNRMAAQLQDAHATLEERVRRRTSELAAANEGLAGANRELDLHRAEQERLAQQRRMLLNRVITAQEEERQRIARELHDETGQSLTALGLGLEAATAELRSGQDRNLGGRLQSLAHVATGAIEELERLVLDLRPAQLDHLGLVATLRWYVARLRSQSGLETRLEVRGEAQRMQPDVETALFRIAQEALTNVVRHAGAGNVEVVLSFEPDLLSLEVSDDGVGFDAEAKGVAPTSLGLIGMRERAHLVDGVLAVRSRPGEGTRISVTVPLEGEHR